MHSSNKENSSIMYEDKSQGMSFNGYGKNLDSICIKGRLCLSSRESNLFFFFTRGTNLMQQL